MNLSNFTSGGTFCLSKAGLAEGTNANTIKTAAPNGAGTDYCIGGVLYHKADTDNITVTACAVQADLTTCLYTVSIDSAGTVTTTKGNEVLTAQLGDGNSACSWPAVPAGNCVLGGIKVVTSGGTFTAGSTDLGAGTVTDTYYDFFALPGTVVGA
jgi:hypothetical protein